MKISFPDKCSISEDINIDQLTRLLYKRKFNYISSYINKVVMIGLINSETTGLKKGNEIQELYIVKIELLRPGIPVEFLKRLDNYIEFPVLYCLEYKNVLNWVLPIFNSVNNKKESPLRIFYTGWIESDKNDNFRINMIRKNNTNIDEVYKNIMNFMCGLKDYDDYNYTIKQYIEKLEKIIQKNNYLKLFFKIQVFLRNELHIDIGSKNFNSMFEYFTCYTKKNPRYIKSKFELKYLLELGYENFEIAPSASRKMHENYFAISNYIVDVKLNNGPQGYLKQEINNVFVNNNFEITIDETSSRERSEAEIKEMKLLYGRYLKGRNKTDDEDNKTNKTNDVKESKQIKKSPARNRRSNISDRRKLTQEDIEEMKKFSSKKLNF